ERLEVDARQAGHRTEKLFQLRQLGIKFFKHPFPAALVFVLPFSVPQHPRSERGGLVLGKSAPAGVLKYFACAPSPSRSRNFVATSASKKSAMPRGCRSSFLPISAPMSRC